MNGVWSCHSVVAWFDYFRFSKIVGNTNNLFITMIYRLPFQHFAAILTNVGKFGFRRFQITVNERILDWVSIARFSLEIFYLVYRVVIDNYILTHLWYELWKTVQWNVKILKTINYRITKSLLISPNHCSQYQILNLMIVVRGEKILT